MSKYQLSSDPDACTGFAQIYPQRIEELKQERSRRNPTPNDKVLSRKQAAEFLEISLSTLDRFVRNRSLPFTKIGGRLYFSQRRLLEWLLSKEEMPETWNNETFRAELLDKEESLRLFQINRRIIELNEIMTRIYNSLGEHGLRDEINAEQKRVFDTASKEVFDLIKEESEILKKRKQRLRDYLGIKKDK